MFRRSYGIIREFKYIGYILYKKRKRVIEKSDESRNRRDEQRRKYSKMDKRAKDKLVRSPRGNGGV